ncbi:MAG: hypothetical protein Q4C85_08780 [Actinomyces sp.]|uniref:hypothetical protein n=1 Tax=Actinomyces sp. TaxID=29317 RepID=UPI0026DAE1F1|nr:hypothetical protein [Actinomyces sp.]MDO4243833.1 hypothetical protein [Actinomyces sp.]
MSTESTTTPTDAPEGAVPGSPDPEDSEELGTGAGSAQQEAASAAARADWDSAATTPLDGPMGAAVDATTPEESAPQAAPEPVAPAPVGSARPVPSTAPREDQDPTAAPTTQQAAPESVAPPRASAAPVAPAPVGKAQPVPSAAATTETADAAQARDSGQSPDAAQARGAADAAQARGTTGSTEPREPAAEPREPTDLTDAASPARPQHLAPHRETGDTAVRRRSLLPSEPPEATGPSTGAASEAVTQPVSQREARDTARSPVPPAASASPTAADGRRAADTPSRRPAGAVKPAEPGQPVAPGTPLKPAEPPSSVKPGQPVAPGTPLEPTEPDQPEAAARSHRAVGHGRHVSTERSEDEVLLDGSVTLGQPQSRAGSHWAGVLVSIVALPVSWYFLHLGAARAVEAGDPLRFSIHAGALTALAIGACALVVALWTARRSSLGVTVVGVLSTLIGVVAVALPSVLSSALTPTLERLTIHSDLGADLAAYLWTDAVTGKFLAFGLFMLMVGWVSHSARRAGRREQEVIIRGRHAA